MVRQDAPQAVTLTVLLAMCIFGRTARSAARRPGSLSRQLPELQSWPFQRPIQGLTRREK